MSWYHKGISTGLPKPYVESEAPCDGYVCSFAECEYLTQNRFGEWFANNRRCNVHYALHVIRQLEPEARDRVMATIRQ